MKLSCKDLDPTTPCDFEATGDSKSEVAARMMEHAKVDHADKVSGMLDSDMAAMMEAKVHE